MDTFANAHAAARELPALPFRHEAFGWVKAPIAEVFAHLDDHTRLSAHMSKASWKMGGGKMTISFDERGGKRVGSKIELAGRVFGVALSVEEVVTEREPPQRKTWVTVGQPRLLVIDHYRLGFELRTQGDGVAMRVFIDYALPRRGLPRLLGLAFGRYYARWCASRMIKDAGAHFAIAGPQRAAAT